MDEARQWAELDPNSATKSYVLEMIRENDQKAFSRYFSGRVPFGTAGLRAAMGPGPTCMNDLLVIQTAQAMVETLFDQFTESVVQSRGVVLGFDHRKETKFGNASKNFALYSAAVFLSKGVKIYFYENFCATPLVPFAINKYKAVCGVMVTASHNPKQDNGYKVYWDNGCQIISPIDEYISKNIPKNFEPWKNYGTVSVSSLKETYGDLIQLCFNECFGEYMLAAKSKAYVEMNSSPNPLKFVYTAMHGVGTPFTSHMLENFGIATDFKSIASSWPHIPPTHATQPVVFCTPEQVIEDPEFPTVDFPNPEEGAGALKLAMEAAEKRGARIILANDPDADRLAIAEFDAKWKIFSGNEIAALFIWWQLQRLSFRNETELSKYAVVTSTVSSKLSKKIAQVEGLTYGETLTGFKWIGNKCIDFERQGKQVLFSYEEAIGFCIDDLVKDKDGVVAAAVFAQMANYLHNTENKTCQEKLEDIYAKYGFFHTSNGYVISHDMAKNEATFKRIRNEGNYIQEEDGWKVTRVRDLLAPGYDSATEDNKPDLPVSDSSNMISFLFEKEGQQIDLTLRMSGTEPKLKYYAEINGPGDRTVLQNNLEKFISKVIKAKMLQSQ